MSTFRSLLMIPRQRYHIAASQGRTKQHAIAKGNGDTATTRRQSRRSKQRKAIAIVNRIHPKGIPLTIEVNPTATNIFIGLGSTTSLTCSQIFRFVSRSPVAPRSFGAGANAPAREEYRSSRLTPTNVDTPCFSGILFAFQGFLLCPPTERESWRQNDVARFRNGPLRKAAVKAPAPK